MNGFVRPNHANTARRVKRLTAVVLSILLIFAICSSMAVSPRGSALPLQSDTDVYTIRASGTDSNGDAYLVTAQYTAEALIPSDAILLVRSLDTTDDDYDDVLEMTGDALGVAAEDVVNPRFFDISIADRTDTRVHYQPAGDAFVDISIRFETTPSTDLSVVHFGEDEPEILDSTTEGDTLSFETNGFSLYAIVDAPTDADLSGLIAAQSVSEFEGEGYLLGAASSSGKIYWMKTGTVSTSNAGVVINRTAANDPTGAERYYFEKLDGTSNQFYIYYLDANNVRKYIKLTTNSNAEFTTTPGTVFAANPCGGQNTNKFFLTFEQNGVTYYLNLRKGDSGKGFNGSTYDDSGSMITLYRNTQMPDDPFNLDGKSYGIVRYTGPEATTVAEMTNVASPSGTKLVRRTQQLQMNPIDYESNLIVADPDLTMWTFHSIEGQKYYISTQVNGVTKYLSISGTSALLVDTPDENSVITVTNGSGTYVGRYQFTSPGGKLSFLSGDNPYFGGGSGNSSSTWLKLAEPSVLDPDDLVSYSAEKVSVSDYEHVKNGDQVVIYTRVWNDAQKRYDFYVVNHNGNLILCYDEGDTIRWEGSTVNTMLWDFTEYYYSGTTTPNYYYELQNVYSGKYLAPQIENGQILSNSTIGVNLNGRRWGDYYTNIMAWDDPHYDYAALATDGTQKIIPVPMAQGMDFYFAKMEPTNVELTTADTVDNDQYGIKLRMIKFPPPIYGNSSTNGGRNQLQTDVIGEGTDYVSGNYLKFPTLDLVSNQLDANGYPTALLTQRSLEDLFGDATDANHLFLQEVYNESGYFQYDCTQTFATLGDDGNFTVYNQLGTINVPAASQGHGQFMPYNDLDPTLVSDYVYTTDVHNNAISLNNPRYGEELLSIPVSEAQYHFGMEMEASFIQSEDGLDDWGHDIIFEFAGDDDMWLYVDGELVLDLGGIHSALVGKINFSTGVVTIPIELSDSPTPEEISAKTSGGAAILVTKTLREIFEENYRERNPNATDPEVTEYLDGIFVEGGTVFKNYSSHTMKMFYMERGASMSNLHMRFNLNTAIDGQLLLEKTVTGTDKQEYSNARFPYQIWYFDKGYNEWRTVSRSDVLGEDNTVVSYTYTGASSVNYAGTGTPVDYQSSYENLYNDVFFLTPGQVADIRFPDDTTQYFVRECYLDTTVYDEVTANDVPLTGVPVDSVHSDFSTEPEVIGKRKVVNFKNHVDEDTLGTLLITKKLYDALGNPLSYEDDQTGFRFRLYMGSTEPLDYYRLDKYHVKDPNGNYCVYDSAAGAFASTGVSDFSQLTEAQQQAATFTTSPSGAIDKIPADYTVEIRNLLVDTKFRVEERASDIPRGYNLIEYARADNVYDPTQGDTLNSGTLRYSDVPHVLVKNQRGWGLTVQKVWTDNDFMQSHDDIYFAIYNTAPSSTNTQPIEGTVRRYSASDSSLYYYFEELEDGVVFSDYVTREVLLTNPVVDENGYVTSYDSITPVDPGGILPSGGIQQDGQQYVTYSYQASYTVGQPTGSNLHIRTDTVTNSRPGIRIVKTDWAGNPLPGAVFTLRDEDDAVVGAASYTSRSDGLVTIAYLEDDIEYTLTEVSVPAGYQALLDSLTMELDDGVLTVSGAPQGAVTVDPDDPSGMLTVTVKNKEMQLQFLKVDEADQSPLAGAHFALYRQVNSINGPRKDYVPISGFENLVTDNDGVIPGLDQTLPVGVYYLTETAAPNGYLPQTADLCFSVDDHGVVTVLTETAQDWLTLTYPTTNQELYTVSVPNHQTVKLVLLKTDPSGDLALSGASFALYRASDYDTTSQQLLPGVSPIKTGTTNAAGLWEMGGLPVGNYCLIETQAPFGCVLFEDPLWLTVTQSGATIVQDGNSQNAVLLYGSTYRFTVINEVFFEMPSVGGVGVIPFYAVGALLFSGSVCLLILMRRKKPRRSMRS